MRSGRNPCWVARFNRIADRGDYPRDSKTIVTRDEWLTIVRQAVDEMPDAFEIEPARRPILIVPAVWSTRLELVAGEGDPLVVLVDLHATSGSVERHGGIDD